MQLARWRNKRNEPAGREEAAPLARFRTEMDRVFDRMFHDPFGALAQWPRGDDLQFLPQLDLTEDERHVTLRIELPGVKPEDVAVEASGRMLTVRGEKKHESHERSGGCVHRECSYGMFSRTIELPASVNADKLTAEFREGVLTVRAEKTADARTRKVKVRNA